MLKEQIVRWRLILGKSTEEDLQNLCRCGGGEGEGALLAGEAAEIDEALEVVYPSEAEADQSGELTREEWAREPGDKHGSVKGRSFPRVARWLGEVRRLFPK